MAVDLEALIADERPDLIVREPTEYASALVGEKHGIPVATLEFAFPMNHAEISKDGTLVDDDEFGRLRAWFGLPPTDDVDWFIGDLQLVAVPDSYRLGIEVRHNHLLMRPHALGVVDDAVVPPWVDDLDGAIYVTFGTVFPMFTFGPLGKAIEAAARFRLDPATLTADAVEAAVREITTVPAYGEAARALAAEFAAMPSPEAVVPALEDLVR